MTYSSKRNRKDMLAGLGRVEQFYQIESDLDEVGVESDFVQSDAFEALHFNSEGEFYPVQIQPLSDSCVADCAIHCHLSVPSNVEWAEQLFLFSLPLLGQSLMRKLVLVSSLLM